MLSKDFVKLKDFVNKKLTSADKVVSAEGVPLMLENCKKYKRMRDLKVYGNSIQEGEVLFDISTMALTKGYYLTNNGEEVAQGSWDISDYIEVNGYEFTLTNVGGSAPYVCAYDENKNFIKGVRYVTGGASVKRNVRITSSSTLIKYIRFSIANTWISDGTISDIKILYYVPSPETPIDIKSVGNPISDNYYYGIPVTTRGTNLLFLSAFILCSETINGITFTVLDENRIHVKGKAIKQVTTTWGGSDLYEGIIPLHKGTYNFKVSNYSANEFDCFLELYDGESFSNNILMYASDNSTTLDYPVSVADFYFRIKGEGLTKEWDDIFELQLIKGTEDILFEPGVKQAYNGVVLKEPLRRIGEYADYIDIKNKKVVRQIGERILDGVSADKRVKKVKFHESTGLYYAVYYGVSSFDGSQKVLRNTHFKTEFDPKVKLGTTYIRGAGGTALIMTHTNQKLNTVDLWNKWLQEQYNAGTPVTIDYVLTTPIEEPLTFYPSNTGIPKLISKTSIIEVDTDIAPSNMVGKFIKK